MFKNGQGNEVYYTQKIERLDKVVSFLGVER